MLGDFLSHLAFDGFIEILSRRALELLALLPDFCNVPVLETDRLVGPRPKKAAALGAAEVFGSIRTLVLERVPNGLFGLAEALLNSALGFVGGAVGSQIVIAGRLSKGVLDVAASLFGRALHFVFVHEILLSRSRLERRRGSCGHLRTVSASTRLRAHADGC